MALATSTSGISGITPDQYGQLIVTPLRQQSVAMLVSTVVETGSHNFHIPVLDSEASASWTAEGATIDESDPGFEEITVTPSKIATLSTLSNELASDSSPAATQVVGDSLVQALKNAIDAAYFGDTITNGPSGLESLSTAPSIGTVGTVPTDLDLFAEAISKIEQDGAECTAFALNPVDWLAITKLKTGSDRNVPLLGADASIAGAKNVFGVQVHTSPQVAQGTAWAVSQARSYVVLRSDVSVDVDRSVKFNSDSVVVRAIARIGFAFPSAKSVVKIAVGPADDESSSSSSSS